MRNKKRKIQPKERPEDEEAHMLVQRMGKDPWVGEQ